MGALAAAVVAMGDVVITDKEVQNWRQAVISRREELFRKHWKNRRQIPDLISRGEARDFEFVVEWYDESDDVISRDQERRRMDRLIARGIDVNLPREKQPVV